MPTPQPPLPGTDNTYAYEVVTRQYLPATPQEVKHLRELHPEREYRQLTSGEAEKIMRKQDLAKRH